MSTEDPSTILDDSAPFQSNGFCSDSFHVVGIGASAGGLEALEAFFANVPPNSGMAFVVVQHLSPDFKSLMDEILARQTRLPIFRVENGMAVQPNAVYLIPPKKEMIISGRKLLLTDKDPSQSLTLPIDIFFRSLAQDLGPCAVGVILSGTGSDGSRGIRAIHEAGGMVIVQGAETAKFDGMPKSAIETGVVDLILPPGAIPGGILHLLHQTNLDGVLEAPSKVPTEGKGIKSIFRILRDEYGIDFSHYKPSTVGRRIERRLQINHSEDIQKYADRLKADSTELNSLYKDLLIGVTKFFRDKEAYDILAAEILSKWSLRNPRAEEFRIWVAGCATGEEAYSIAILIRELAKSDEEPLPIKIFATDVHRASLEFASAGVYSEANLANVSKDRLDRFFLRHPSGYQVCPELRKMIVFAPHNLLKDAPFTKLDLISCRNLLIYFQPLAQKKVLSLFHFGLKTGGILFLGPSESPGEIAEEFESLDNHWKIYRKRRDVRLPPDMRLPITPSNTPIKEVTNPLPSFNSNYPDVNLVRSYDLLLNEFIPPSFLINEKRELVHIFSDAGKYLSRGTGRISNDILDLLDRQLRFSTAAAIQRALKERSTIVHSGITLPGPEGEQSIQITVKPLVNTDGSIRHFLLQIENLDRADRKGKDPVRLQKEDVSEEHFQALESELRYTKENLQAAIEELETSNEELQATNEELVASNEELQSTNEELHSVNEELFTVNVEHQRKIVELTELTDDMADLFRSTDIGTIFLDREMRIRRFTPKILHSFQILNQDVGRPINAFTHNLKEDALFEEIQQVLTTGERIEKDIQDRQDNWFLLRILPYYRQSRIDGVVLSLIDVSLLKTTEQKLRRMSRVYVDAIDPIILESFSGVILDVNSEVERFSGWSREELIGQPTLKLFSPDYHANYLEIRKSTVSGKPIQNAEMVWVPNSKEPIPVLLSISVLSESSDHQGILAVTAKDISSLKEAEQEIREYAQKLEQVNLALREHAKIRQQAEEAAKEGVRRRDEFLAMLSHELRNPLGAITNATTVIARSNGDVKVLRSASEIVRRQAQQMARLLDDLLDVSRITQGKIEIRQETLDLRSLVHDTVEAIKPHLDSRNHQLEVNLPSEPLYILGDPARILQIQDNLLINAAKYTPHGGRISLTLKQEGSEGVISVKDNGKGIPKEMLEKIFDLFVQINDPEDTRNSSMGIGLTLVRKLVSLHGGTVSAQSAGIGQGAEFIVRLPLCIPAKSGSTNRRLQAAMNPHLRMLLIEDNADSRTMLQTILELDGHQVAAAEDGKKGLEVFASGEFDVALVDINLPEMDGFTVARMIREKETTHRTHLVALTGYGRPQDRDAVLQAGFDDHLVKPLRQEQLEKILQKVRESTG